MSILYPRRFAVEVFVVGLRVGAGVFSNPAMSLERS